MLHSPLNIGSVNLNVGVSVNARLDMQSSEGMRELVSYDGYLQEYQGNFNLHTAILPAISETGKALYIISQHNLARNDPWSSYSLVLVINNCVLLLSILTVMHPGICRFNCCLPFLRPTADEHPLAL